MKFSLEEYISNIRAYMMDNKKSPAAAVHDFIINLSVMRPHYKGFGDLNFHELGQRWNNLLYTERNKQTGEALRKMSQSVQPPRRKAERGE